MAVRQICRLQVSALLPSASALRTPPLHAANRIARKLNKLWGTQQTRLSLGASWRGCHSLDHGRSAAAGGAPAAMDEDVHQLISHIHDSATQAVLYATGGGFQVMMGVPVVVC